MTEYFAILHRYNTDAVDANGDLVGTVLAFRSLKLRNAWLRAGDPVVRRALSRKIPAERRAIEQFYA